MPQDVQSNVASASNSWSTLIDGGRLLRVRAISAEIVVGVRRKRRKAIPHRVMKKTISLLDV